MRRALAAAALALAAAAAPARAGLSYVEARALMLGADTVAVEHSRVVLFTVRDERGGEHRRYRTERLTWARADTSWGHAFARALLAAGPSDSLRRCVPRPDAGDSVDTFVAGVTWRARGHAVGALLFFGARCAQVFGDGGPAASIDLGAGAQGLLTRIQQALPADSAFGALAMAEPLPADTASRTFPLALPTPVDVLPRALTIRQPKWPADGAGPGPVEVRLLVLVDENGAVADARAKAPRPPFDAAAIAAVRTWRFQPARRGGHAVSAWVEIPVRFEVR